MLGFRDVGRRDFKYNREAFGDFGEWGECTDRLRKGGEVMEGCLGGLFWRGRQKFIPISEKLSLFLRDEGVMRRKWEKEKPEQVKGEIWRRLEDWLCILTLGEGQGE